MAKRGRPAFKATKALRREIEQMTFCRMSEDDIARALGISTPTLQKHFADELLVGRARRARELTSLKFKQARRGSVTAMRLLEQKSGNATPTPSGDVALGKKEKAQLAAQNPDTATPMGELMARRAADVTKLH